MFCTPTISVFWIIFFVLFFNKVYWLIFRSTSPCSSIIFICLAQCDRTLEKIMDLPAVFLLFTQNDRSLEDHTCEFLDLANHTHYPDSTLISFFWTGLNEQVKHLVLLSTYLWTLLPPLAPFSPSSSPGSALSLPVASSALVL